MYLTDAQSDLVCVLGWIAIGIFAIGFILHIKDSM